jgi:hypothetical protein
MNDIAGSREREGSALIVPAYTSAVQPNAFLHTNTTANDESVSIHSGTSAQSTEMREYAGRGTAE